MRKGFTLIELMIVIGIIAVIASIAIPSLAKSKIQANENAAAACMKTFHGMLATYRTKGYQLGRGVFPVGGSGISTNLGKYCGMYYEVNNAGDKVVLIGMTEANADARADGSLSVAAGNMGSYIPRIKTTQAAQYLAPATFRLYPKQGYWFAMCQQKINHYTYNFTMSKMRYAMIAFPDEYGTDGELMFVICEEGIVYGQDFGITGFKNYPENTSAEGWLIVK